jgi:hypothetical protein
MQEETDVGFCKVDLKSTSSSVVVPHPKEHGWVVMGRVSSTALVRCISTGLQVLNEGGRKGRGLEPGGVSEAEKGRDIVRLLVGMAVR